jgi:squalene synthase HpnC
LTVREAEAYTRTLATSHYENFHVATGLLPKRLRQDFYNVYAYCRWADDLADETGNREESLRLLGDWRRQLRAMYAGEARHGILVALQATVRRHELPIEPFEDLIGAFERDQVKARYANWAEVLEYCRGSANPVGRLVLMLCGYRDAARFRMSDATCSGLQLANFWQDVTLDWAKGRVYLPLDLLGRHGATVEQIGERRFDAAFREAMREAVAYARALFEEGLPLSRTVARWLALDIALFSRGGLAVLAKIERQGYDVLRSRPKLTRLDKAAALMRGLAAWAAFR